MSDPIIWTDREGGKHDVATMDSTYAANILAFLERRASTVLRQYAWNSALSLPDDDQVGEMALDLLTHEVDRLWNLAERAKDDPQVAVDWLWEDRRPLMEALALRTVPA